MVPALHFVLSLAFSAAPSVCEPLPSGILPLGTGDPPLSRSGDFNGDGRVDVLRFVSLAPATALPANVTLANALGKEPAVLPAGGLKRAVLVSHMQAKGACQHTLLPLEEFLATPTWDAFVEGKDAQAATLVKKGTKAHQAWKKKVKGLKADALELATEAGIPVLLHHTRGGYVVFFPAEEP